MFVHSTDILLTPIEYLKGVGPVKATLLQKELQVFTFGDLLRIFPFRYTDRSKIISIANIPAEGGVVQLCGQIIHFDRVGAGRTQRLVASFRDATGTIELVWFAAISFFEKVIQEGGPFLLYGQAQKFNGYWTISHPELERFDPEKDQRLPQFTPVYPSTEKLRKQWLAGKPYVKLVQQLVAMLQPAHLPEFLPEKIRYARNLITWYEAYCAIHFPQNALQLHAAEIRLKFDELFIQQVTIARLKLNHRKQSGYTFQQVGSFFQTFYSSYLPFELTDDQKEVLREIRSDTRTGYQMNRLLQGDVGSGKTIVALLCMLLAVDNGFQACLMAPTEILARQHWQGIDELLRELPVKVAFLSGRTKGKERKSILDELKRGEIHVLIGTHALIEEPVEFHNLGLCIVDEQHRFGVAQRAKMYGKNALPPHMLVMTATPIPRTLAMTVYGDLDVSVIRHLPPGRKAITTVHRPEIQRAKVMDFLRVEIDKGRQVYIVYPLIEESEKLDYENLQSGYEQVKQYFPEPRYRIVMVHGKQSAEERESNMDRFVKGEAHIMVATTVIEVGVNVPNASVMLIESAERFGLLQLHQLRGRVGRGADQSFCILLSTDKISAFGRKRMQTMVEESSGFAIAEKDLELRGPGELDGTRQSGSADLKLADIVKDAALLQEARDAAFALLQDDPALEKSEHTALRKFLMQRKDKEIWSRIS